MCFVRRRSGAFITVHYGPEDLISRGENWGKGWFFSMTAFAQEICYGTARVLSSHIKVGF